MDYSEVQEYSRVYRSQELYTDHQRRTLERIAAALALVTDDPHKAPPGDLAFFRQQVLAMRADLLIEEQLARQLSGLYAKTLE